MALPWWPDHVPQALFPHASLWNEAFSAISEDTEIHSIRLKTYLFGNVNELEHRYFNRHRLFSVNSLARLEISREINRTRLSSMKLASKLGVDLYTTVEEVKQGQDRPRGTESRVTPSFRAADLSPDGLGVEDSLKMVA